MSRLLFLFTTTSLHSLNFSRMADQSPNLQTDMLALLRVVEESNWVVSARSFLSWAKQSERRVSQDWFDELAYDIEQSGHKKVAEDLRSIWNDVDRLLFDEYPNLKRPPSRQVKADSH